MKHLYDIRDKDNYIHAVSPDQQEIRRIAKNLARQFKKMEFIIEKDEKPQFIAYWCEPCNCPKLRKPDASNG